MRYAVVIEKGERIYSAYVPDLPGCASVGDTLENTRAGASGHDERRSYGQKFIQVDSYGRAEREIPGKKSQTFQLDEKSARELFDILRDCFQFR